VEPAPLWTSWWPAYGPPEIAQARGGCRHRQDSDEREGFCKFAKSPAEHMMRYLANQWQVSIDGTFATAFTGAGQMPRLLKAGKVRHKPGLMKVDIDDLDKVKGLSWFLAIGYANARLKDEHRSTVALHRYVIGAKPGEIVDHVNGVHPTKAYFV
jgi:hypothetical protein